MRELFDFYKDEYQNDQPAAQELNSLGESNPHRRYAIVDQAVWTMIANTILNLDEFVTKE